MMTKARNVVDVETERNQNDSSAIKNQLLCCVLSQCVWRVRGEFYKQSLQLRLLNK